MRNSETASAFSRCGSCCRPYAVAAAPLRSLGQKVPARSNWTIVSAHIGGVQHHRLYLTGLDGESRGRLGVPMDGSSSMGRLWPLKKITQKAEASPRETSQTSDISRHSTPGPVLSVFFCGKGGKQRTDFDRHSFKESFAELREHIPCAWTGFVGITHDGVRSSDSLSTPAMRVEGMPMPQR